MAGKCMRVELKNLPPNGIHFALNEKLLHFLSSQDNKEPVFDNLTEVYVNGYKRS